MTQKVITRLGEPADGSSLASVVVAIAQDHARRVASGIASLTDSSAGVAANAATITGSQVAFVNVANAGGNLALSATAQPAFQAVEDGIGEIIAKADAILTALGQDPGVTDNSGAEAANGTIAAIDVAITAGAVGIQAASCEVIRAALNNYLLLAAKLTNKVANATGGNPVKIALPGSSYALTVAAIGSTVTGTSASPGVTAVAANAYTAAMAANIAKLAAILNAAVHDTVVPNVVVVG